MNNFLNNFYNATQTEVSAALIIFNVLLSFALCSCVVWVWRKTHRGLSYSQSFAVTMMMLGPLASSVMMIVQNNLVGAFALLGAFSLIRFRTILKETRDIAFLFFTLTIGVATGTGYYSLALLTTLLVSTVVLILYRFNFASTSKTGFLLTFHTINNFNTKNLDTLFAEHITSKDLLHEKVANDGNEYAYSIHFKKTGTENMFMNKLREVSGISDGYLITGKDTIEY